MMSLYNSSKKQILLGYLYQRNSLHSFSCTSGPCVTPLHILSLAPWCNPFSSGRTCTFVCLQFTDHTRGPCVCPHTLPVVLVISLDVSYSSVRTHPSMWPHCPSHMHRNTVCPRTLTVLLVIPSSLPHSYGCTCSPSMYPYCTDHTCGTLWGTWVWN